VPLSGDMCTQQRRDAIQVELDRLAGEILAHIATSPDDFDGREQLYMDRENLRYEMRWLS
jgi:hypothetical protein